MEQIKQTAVEWLVEQLKERGYAGEFPPHILFEQAKAMEKEQMIDAFEDSRILSITNNCNSGEQYYNEQYGGNK
jgi:hypothetical protein